MVCLFFSGAAPWQVQELADLGLNGRLEQEIHQRAVLARVPEVALHRLEPRRQEEEKKTRRKINCQNSKIQKRHSSSKIVNERNLRIEFKTNK